jgi:hypothetical protein
MSVIDSKINRVRHGQTPLEFSQHTGLPDAPLKDRHRLERGNRRPKFNINPGSPAGRGKRRGSGRS